MRRSSLIALTVASLCLGASGEADAEVRRALLSVVEVGSSADAPISRFEIKTWGVSLLAICHIPPSWHIGAEKFEDPEGVISGRADWHGQPLSRLTDLLLVDVYDFQPAPRGDPRGEYHPASFAGWVELGGDPEKPGRRVVLNATNFRLLSASRCPDPPQAQP